MRHHRRGRNPDANKLIIYHNPTGSATFDPTITLSQSGTVIWQTEAGTTVTTGTNHALSYTPTAGPKVCKVTVLGGLGSVTGINCNTDAVASIKGINRCHACTDFKTFYNDAIKLRIYDIPRSVTYADIGNSGVAAGISGDLSELPPAIQTFYAVRITSIAGALSSLPSTLQSCYLYNDTGITPASIAHLVIIRGLHIYSMGWTAQQNTDVLLSAWNARANYTYASGIQLRIGVPTGTPGTEPPAAGESNADWSWNAGTSRHDPLTGYAVKADLENDFYTEGFKTWTVTVL